MKPICDNCAFEAYEQDQSLVFTPVNGVTECGRCGMGMDKEYILWVSQPEI